MLFKNTFKLMFSNSHLIWKILLYVLISSAIIFGLSFFVALPVVQILINENFFVKVGEVYTAFIDTLDLNL